MKLISCNNPKCAIVIDLDKRYIPEIYDQDGVITDDAAWDGETFLPTIECPACMNKIVID